MGISELQNMHIWYIVAVMNLYEYRNLLQSEDRKERRMTFFRKLIKSVEVGANGTQDYVVKNGSGKNKVASTRQ